MGQKKLLVVPAAPQDPTDDSQGVDLVALQRDGGVTLVCAEEDDQARADLNAFDLNGFAQSDHINPVVGNLVLRLVDKNRVAGFNLRRHAVADHVHGHHAARLALPGEPGAIKRQFIDHGFANIPGSATRTGPR